MASDNLRQVGRYLRQTNRTADLALKKARKKMPVKDRVRDNISNIYPFTMQIETEGPTRVVIDINFNKPPPSDCISECIGTVCEDFDLSNGGHSVNVVNPYEAGTVKVYAEGEPLDSSQWSEEEPSAGKVYVQVQDFSKVIAICYVYIAC